VEIAELAFNESIKLDDRDASVYISMANTYALADRRDDEAKIRTKMEAKCPVRIQGRSRITIDGRSHWFVANDNRHPEIKLVDAMWNKLSVELEKTGYYPNTAWVCREGTKELKLALLCRHSEKLAICYGLVKTKPGDTLFITNNLRVCGDCHYATLMISLITKRKIVVRDACRYHHFENGQCSCGGFW
jgi:DYW family of nucleic acid deaminases